jgi:hypothetical protein
MASQSVTYDFLSQGADRLASDFRKTGDTAALAARGVRLAADAMERQERAGKVAADGLAKAERASAMLAVAERELDKEIEKTNRALAGQAVVADKAGKGAAGAAGGFSKLAGGGGIPGGGMGAAVAAGVVLAPVLVTLGTGFAGLGLAAYGIAKPIENAAAKTGGLRANLKLLDPEQRAVAVSILGLGKQYAQFQQALKPEVLGIFNAGIKLAGGLMRDITPVAKATGVAFNGFLSQVDKTFASGTWQQFFKFMATTAAPDMKLLGDNFLHLLNLLPPLLQALQPLATEFLSASDNALKLAGSIANLGKSTDKTSASVGTNTGLLGFLAKAVANVNSFMKPGGVLAGAMASALGGIPPSAGAAGASMGGAATKAQTLASQLAAARAEVTKLTTAENAALSPLLAYTNALITQKTDSVALATALKASSGAIGLNTATQRASFSAAQTYIQDLLSTSAAAVKSHQGIDAQIASLRTALPILQNVRGGTKQYWQEVSTLTDWLHKLEAIKAINKKITMQGDGTFRITDLSGQGLGVQGPPPGVKKAAGGYITGGVPGRDSVLILAMPGEVVVPTDMVRAGAVDHLRGKLPGFASGGIVGNLTPGFISGMLPEFTKVMTDAMVTAMRAAMKAAVSAASAAASSGAPGAQGGPTSASAAQAQAYARSRLGAYGWGAGQMPPLILLWNQESGWNRLARNPSSGAYGIPQSLPASKMGAAANPPTSSAAAQINWGLGYIKGRYGSPAGAWAHEQAFNWYDRGGWLMPGLTLAANNTGRPEQVIPGDGLAGLAAELRALRAEVRQLTGVAAAIPAATGRHVAAGVNGTGADAAFRRRYPGR